MIIAADLLDWQVKTLADVLKMFVKAIWWTIEDIVGIPSGLCTYKINILTIVILMLSTKGG